jgi:ABC-type branched-subunit amino acid transport system ATPase component
MTETLTLTSGGADAIGPGKLVLVVGPSGAGKDTLLGMAKAACAASGGENALRQQADLFAPEHTEASALSRRLVLRAQSRGPNRREPVSFRRSTKARSCQVRRSIGSDARMSFS